MIFASVVFAGAGRPPEDERADIVALDLGAQRLAGTNQMLLPDVFVEGARTHAIGKRTACDRPPYPAPNWV